MSKIDVTDRLEFLAEKFDVFECEEQVILDKTDELLDAGYTEVNAVGDSKLFILSSKENIKKDSKGREIIKVQKHVSICFDVFNDMVKSDPSKNKMYTQWMLNVFVGLIKAGDKEKEAIRFVEEDLPMAEEYLVIFEANKRKKKFKELCNGSYVLKGVNDPTNINQYKSLTQLYDAVDPFIERDPSDMEKTMQRFIDSGQAYIPVRDRKFTVFVPKTRDANVIFDKFASWCTATPGNGMFKSYTTTNTKPDGTNSDIYIVINNKFFEGELLDNHLYQIHFETKQLRNRKQNGGGNFFEDVILESEGVANFFHDELMKMAKEKGDTSKNIYIDYLIKLGWTEALFEMIEDYTPVIRFQKREVPKLPDISKFTKLHTFIISNAKMVELHPSIGSLKNLQQLLVPDNKLTALPKEIGNLTNLIFMNLTGNKITEIPDDIKYLDKSNGGSLHRIAVRREEIGEANYQKLKDLLPSTKM